MEHPDHSSIPKHPDCAGGPRRALSAGSHGLLQPGGPPALYFPTNYGVSGQDEPAGGRSATAAGFRTATGSGGFGIDAKSPQCSLVTKKPRPLVLLHRPRTADIGTRRTRQDRYSQRSGTTPIYGHGNPVAARGRKRQDSCV